MGYKALLHETGVLSGKYSAQLFDPNGELIAEWEWSNIVCTVGKNLLLDAGLAGNSYTVNGPFLGLVTASGYTGVNVADTMASHAGWTEATSYNGPRKTMIWAPATGGSKTVASPCFFEFTTDDVIRGAFVLLGPTGTNVVGGTSGVLYSVGVFPADQHVVNGASMNVVYTASL
jgi:hypothetical protein